MKKYILITAILFFPFSILYGQITTEEDPISFGRNIPALTRSGNTQKVLPPLDMDIIEKEDVEDEANGIPPRFGFRHQVNFNLNNSGEWITLANGDRLWRLSISCPDALSINLLYDQFWLPDGAKFFIYTPDYSKSIGAVTAANNKGERDNIRGFATEIMYGDQVILEYYIPCEVNEVGVISIAYVVHGYRYIFIGENSAKDFGDSYPNCHNNVNCSGNYKWKKEKDAIALIVVAGHRACTGALINTTADDYRPYLLTAEHCLDNTALTAYSHLDFWSFCWHYESPDCTSTDPGLRPVFYSTSGGEVLSYNTLTDFALIELHEDPRNKNKVTPFYLGWDRMEYSTAGGFGTGGVGIHHPKGDIKKISFADQMENDPFLRSWDNGGTSLPNTHWRVRFINGTAEGGSSGSPFINDELRVIGQLHGGDTSCDVPLNKYYGKLNVSWDTDPNTERQLKYWLDPNNTGLMTYNGTFECDGNVTISNKSYNSGANDTEEGCRITVSNTTFNNNSTVNFYAQEKIVLNTGTKANGGSLVRFMVKGNQDRGRDNGRSDDKSLVSTETIDELDDNNYMSTPFESSIDKQSSTNTEITIFPNPNSGSFTISTTSGEDIQQVEIINLLGQVIYQESFQNSTINIPNGAKGTFFVRITTLTNTVVKKIIVQ